VARFDRDDSGITTHPAQPPTSVRYQVLGSLGALSLILYLDRVCIGQALVPIRNELRLSNTAMGYVTGAFTLAYGLFEVPTGRWGDRFGSRGVLTRIVLWWSLFTALTGAANGLVMLLIVRFLFGAGEAGALPNVARIIARWFPERRRGFARGLIPTCNQLSASLTPIITGYYIDWFGWRVTFVLFGLVGVVWAVAFYFWFRDNPADHPAVNEAERKLIAGGGVSAPPSEALSPLPWRLVLTSPNVWLMGTIMTCISFASYMYMTWYPTYLQDGRGVPSEESRWLAGLVLGGGAVGSTLGGLASDWLLRRTGERRWSRRVIGCGALTLAAAALLIGVQCDSPVDAALWTSLACLSAQLQIASWWGVIGDISGKHLGALFGLMNSLGVPGAFASQVFLGHLTDWLGARGYTGRAQWDPAFYAIAWVLLLGAGCWLVVDATKSAVAPRDRSFPLDTDDPG
jgi:sugar phosphate permease